MDCSDTDDKINRIKTIIEEGDILLFANGAGWSADSGLPTYNSIASKISVMY